MRIKMPAVKIAQGKELAKEFLSSLGQFLETLTIQILEFFYFLYQIIRYLDYLKVFCM